MVSSRRLRSELIARLCAMPSIQLESVERPSNFAALRQTSKNTSFVSSSATASVLTRRKMKRKTRNWYCVNNASIAACYALDQLCIGRIRHLTGMSR
jgi:hypothetical protein